MDRMRKDKEIDLTKLDAHAIDDFLAQLFLNLVDLNVGHIAVHGTVVDPVAHAALSGLGMCKLVDLYPNEW